MTSTPLVTIAIPAFKTKYLRQAIRSALNQSYENIELIIVNDQSPEDIGSVITEFYDERIRYYVNPQNLGKDNPVNNWNQCLSWAKGEFFCLLCDDDKYEPDFIETLLDLAEKYPQTNVFRARADIIDKDGKVIDLYPSSPEWESTSDYMWHVFKDYRYQTISEFMHRTSTIKECGGYASLPLAWYADYLSVFRFSETGGIASTFKRLVHFRQSGINISSRDDCNTELKLLATQEYIKEVIRMIESNGYERKEHLIDLLYYRTKQITKYSLKYTPRKTLLKLYRQRKRYGISFHQLWRAFWNHKKL